MSKKIDPDKSPGRTDQKHLALLLFTHLFLSF